MSKPKAVTTAKVKVTETVSTVSRVVKNAEQLVQAVSLLIITVFAYQQIKDVTNDVYYYTVFFALVVVGVRAAYEFVRFLNKEK